MVYASITIKSTQDHIKSHKITQSRFKGSTSRAWSHGSTHPTRSDLGNFCTCRTGSTKVPRVFNLLSDITGTHNCSWAPIICLKRPRLSVVSHDNKLKLVLDFVSTLHPKRLRWVKRVLGHSTSTDTHY